MASHWRQRATCGRPTGRVASRVRSRPALRSQHSGLHCAFPLGICCAALALRSSFIGDPAAPTGGGNGRGWSATFVSPPSLRGATSRQAFHEEGTTTVADPPPSNNNQLSEPVGDATERIVETELAAPPEPPQPPASQQGEGGGFLPSLAQILAVLAAFIVGVTVGAAGLSMQQRQLPPEPAVQGELAVPQQLGDSGAAKPSTVDIHLRSVDSKLAVNEIETELPSKLQQELTSMDRKLADLYTSLMDTAKLAGTRIQTAAGMAPVEKAPIKRVPASVAQQIRGIGDILDQAQDDVYNEVWISLETYPQVLEAYLPVMNFYATNAFPDSGDDAQKLVNKAQRDALRFETQSYLRGIVKLDQAITLRKVREVEEAFATTSLAYDRYLKAGDLYSGYDPVTSTTVFFRNILDSQLQYTPIALEQPRIRDEVLILQGPDKGKVGRVIWLGREDGKDPSSKVLSAVVKLDPNPVLGSTPSSRGVKEVKAYPYDWIVLTRSSSENYLQDFLLATIAAVISCGLTYPLETLKCRAQLNLPYIPEEGPLMLFKGVELNILREAPNQGFLMAGFNLLTRTALKLPFVDGNNPNLKFALMIPSGALAMLSGSFAKVPLIDVSKQVQSGVAGNIFEAVENVYLRPAPSQVSQKLVVNLVLSWIKGIPFGAFQCFIYELMKDKTPDLLEGLGCPIFLEPFIWGGVAGFFTGYLTNPPDVVITRMAVNQSEREGSEGVSVPVVWNRITAAAEEIYREEGVMGFNKGGFENALYFAPEAMVWFGVYEALKEVSQAVFK